MMRANSALVKHNGGEPGRGAFLPGPVSIPAADIAETGEAYVVSLDMPGARKDAISVTVADGTLVVRAPARPVRPEGALVLYSEIRTGPYERRFALGRGIDQSGLDAVYENGVLTVRLLKSETMKPKDIAIR